MGAEKKKFQIQLTAFVITMFVSPIAVPVLGRMAGFDSPLVSFTSLFLVLGSMGAICKVAIDREREKKNKRMRKIKSK
ncbi:hypothetical protein EHEL_040335 [Encephalitozoon hellem ATCC 50504]|uniref:Uncharacterized protein n=1 Tax=Encephalitozoon hellem TaxID=27973 RepID=A0A9Q9C5K2_ENCHE|nr:uncharacterized protein EHEL_040335 [Encephalitozoon hellem ATCC 50504]AHL28918.1 hypothetical protein EHEL_040335 [Encephalitozoon hellem ATCC 50504]UTX42927.1 hypothetical protein GPU96_04g06570 [Encephalitozoon hellem]WEL38384.1 hypothetical protein PFJ87_04g00550 [Encephalitozoon hellem]